MNKKKLLEFTPANAEQSFAIAAMIHFINHGDPQEWFTLTGKAGTGKTTIATAVIEPFVKSKAVMIGALAHKAKLVLAQKFAERFGPYAVTAETVASSCSLAMDPETGKFVKSASLVGIAPIYCAEIIIYDEASMINEEALKLILDLKNRRSKIIFMGDLGQLPPIRDGDDSDDLSPTFNTKNTFALTQRIRQGEQSPILPYADHFWENSQSSQQVADPVPDQSRKSVVTEFGSLVFASSANALEHALPLYRIAVESGRPDLVRTVVYRNATRQILNDRVRKYLFDANASDQFVKGELLMFQDNFDDGELEISNATEIQAHDVTRSQKKGWKIWRLGFSFEGKPAEIEVLDRSELQRFRAHLDEMANRIKAMAHGPARSNAWRKFYDEKNMFASIDYGYAITSHKAQGSTYDVVLVAEADIMGVQATSEKAKSQSIYTAITRAKYLAVIMDGRHDEPGAMTAAMRHVYDKTLSGKLAL